MTDHNRYVGALRGEGLRVAIACGRFNDLISDRLLAGAQGFGHNDFKIPLVRGTLSAVLAEA